MNNIIKWTIIVIGCLAVLAFVGFQFMMARTKVHSPQETVTYNQDDLQLSVAYSRPYKKDRVIFGELLPYGEVWRTGANEATEFTTSQNLRIMASRFPRALTPCRTVPNAQQWAVMFNEKSYDWGVNFNGTSPHDPSSDVVSVDVPTQAPAAPVEQFTIRFVNNPLALVLEWDDAQISVPMQPAN